MEEGADVRLPPPLVVVEALELRGRERGLDRVQLRVPAEQVRDVVALAARLDHLAELAHHRHLLGELRVVRRHEPALAAGGEVLRHLEAERGRVAEPADRPAAVRRAVRLRRVLDDREPAPVGDPEDRLHRRREPVQMDGEDGGRPRRDPGLDLARVDRERVRVDVGEDGRRELVQRREPARDEAERRDDHLVARPDPERGERELERDGAVRDRHAVGHAAARRPAPLELGHGRLALGVRDELAARKDAHHGLPVLLGDDRPLDAARLARNGGRPAERRELRRPGRRRGRHRLSTARATCSSAAS